MKSISIMKWMLSHRSIRQRLVIGVTLVHALLMGVFVADLVARQRTFLRDEQVQRTMSLVDGIADRAVLNILTGDLAALQEIVGGFKSYPELGYVMILDPDGRVLAHSDRTHVGQRLSDARSRQMLQGPAKHGTASFTSDSMDLMSPVMHDHRVVGWARLSVGMHKIEDGLQAVAWSGLGYAVVAIVLGAIAAYLTARRVTRRLYALLAVADATAQGQRDRRAPADDEDEVGRVSASFNAMLDALRDRERSLEDGNAALESRVSERTAELRDSEAALRGILENANDAFIGMDETGRICAWNRKAHEIFGWSREEAMGQLLSELIMPPALREMHQRGLQRYLVTGVGTVIDRRIEVPALTRDGRTIPIELSVSVRQRGSARFFDAFLHDISERERARAELVENTHKIEMALAEKETLLKEVYHRVKNNLQVIQSLLSLKRRTVRDQAARSALDDSVQRVRAMALVHEKLYQSGNLTAVSLPDYVRDLVAQISDASGAAYRGVKLHLDIAPLQTKLDSAVPFGLLLTELVANSLKHGFPDERRGDVWVHLTPSEEGARLRVSDNGVGFKLHPDKPPEEMPVSPSGSMGLTLAGSLARQLGGELRSRDDNGAVFEAELSAL